MVGQDVRLREGLKATRVPPRAESRARLQIVDSQVLVVLSLHSKHSLMRLLAHQDRQNMDIIDATECQRSGSCGSVTSAGSIDGRATPHHLSKQFIFRSLHPQACVRLKLDRDIGEYTVSVLDQSCV